MAPRTSASVLIGRLKPARGLINQPNAFLCPICTLSREAQPQFKQRASKRRIAERRCQSTIGTTTDARSELEQTLRELWRQNPDIARSPKLALALQGLQERQGAESIRVAILGLEQLNDDAHVAKSVLKTILADPLKDITPWEQEFDNQNPNKPVIFRVGPDRPEASNTLVSAGNPVLDLRVSCPGLNHLNLEVLCMRISPNTIISQHSDLSQPITDDSTQPPTTFPAHKTIVVANGLVGVSEAVKLTQGSDPAFIKTAVNLRGLSEDKNQAAFTVIDISQANSGIDRIRQGPQYAMEYERLWYSSNLPTLIEWLKSGAEPSEGSSTKQAVRHAITTYLAELKDRIRSKELTELASTQPSAARPLFTSSIASWAEGAHVELRDELDLAFTEKRWRKLGWWKLFWRVDDVAMLTNELLAQRFLPTAERELVYLAGRLAKQPDARIAYPQPTSQRLAIDTSNQEEQIITIARNSDDRTLAPKWPTHISFTRRYLQNETVPALQALAQKLVGQSLVTSGLATSLGALLYVSYSVTTIYEAAAVALLGVVYSSGRMQKKWERAREFWEGEVREEGRKAVKAAEESVVSAVAAVGNEGHHSTSDSLAKAKELYVRAEAALSRLK